MSATGAETDSLPGSDDPPAMPEIHKVTQAGVFVEGVPITFEVTATDDVDDAAALVVTWTFSDGGTAAGKKVRHAFATAGKYTARVTVKDSDGNESWLEVPVSKPIVKRLGDRPRHR